MAWRPSQFVERFECYVDGSVRARVELRRDHAIFPHGVHEWSAERLEPGYVGGGRQNGYTLDFAEAIRTAHMIAAT
jgi:hypothetical protein